MPASLGTQTGLTGIPSLLLSGLQQVEDPTVQTALYQIQNWANSVGLITPTPGTGTATLGSGNFPGALGGGVAAWVKVSVNGTPAYIPAWV
jgi:hypothetical protein